MDNALRYLEIVARAAGFPEPRSLQEIIGSLIGAALGFMGIIFLCIIIYAGFYWMTSGGNEEKIVRAKDILRNAIIGLIIVMASYSITRLVVFSLAEVTVG